MCKYCEKDESELYRDDCNSHSVILKMTKFSNNTKIGIDLYCDCEETSFLQYIDINYCPICGRKLGE